MSQPISTTAFETIEQKAGLAETFGDAKNSHAIMAIPVNIQIILGSAEMSVANLMKLGRGAVIPLDKRVGEPVDIVVNNRIIARGEVVHVEDDNRFGVSLTEIVAPAANTTAA